MVALSKDECCNDILVKATSRFKSVKKWKLNIWINQGSSKTKRYEIESVNKFLKFIYRGEINRLDYEGSQKESNQK